MNHAALTFHATQRIAQRSSLKAEHVRQMMADGATLVVSIDKAGKFSKHLFYSTRDDAWYVAVQCTQNWGVLTFMPLEYQKCRIAVTGAQKRSARRKAREWEQARAAVSVRLSAPVEQGSREKEPDREAAEATCVPEAPAAPDTVTATVATTATASSTRWGVRVCYVLEGKSILKNLGKAPVEHGCPDSWQEPEPVHFWLKEKLVAASIPFRSIHRILMSSKEETQPADCLLEHLPLTEEEMASCL